MTIIFIIATVFYGLLSVAVSLLQLFKTKDNRYLAMLVGGCLLFSSAILWSMADKKAWIGILIGIVAIGIGAWINGGIVILVN